MVLTADISNEEQIRGACDRLAAEWGRIDGVFANAGINGVWAPIEELSREEFDRTISTNLTGSFLTIKYAVPHLRRAGGSVVITSSVNGTRMFSNIGATAYSTYRDAVAFGVLILILLLRPAGILGTATIEKV